MAKDKKEPIVDQKFKPKRRSSPTASVKSWAITWLLAIIAAEWGLLPQPLGFGGELPFWIPVVMDVLRFFVIWFAAHIITRIIFAAWEIIGEYYQASTK